MRYLPLLGVLLLAGPTTAMAAGPGRVTYRFALPTDAALEISVHGRAAEARHIEGDRSRVLAVDRAAIQALVTAEILHPLTARTFAAGDARAVVLVARYPSQRSRPTGPCGAGYEDYLLLVVVRGGTLLLSDRLLVQSCLDSIALASDGPEDPAELLRVTAVDPLRIAAQWLDHPQWGGDPRGVMVSGQRFSVE